MGVTGELCVLYQFAGLYPASGPVRSLAAGQSQQARAGRLAALLVLAASTEFLLVAVAAYFAAVLYHRLILLNSPDAAKYIPESLLISTMHLLVSIGLRQYSRIQTQPRHVFIWSGASSVFFVFAFFISTIFLLKVSGDYSRATIIAQAVSVFLTVLCTRAIWFSLLQPAIASGLIDARRIILIGDPESLPAFFRSSNRHRNSDHPLVRLSDGCAPTPQYRRVPARSKRYLMPANWSQIAGPSERMTLSF